MSIYNNNFKDAYLNLPYDSYSEYMFHSNESNLQYLIRYKYLKILGKFIIDMYTGLKFDIYIRHRDTKEKKVDWYGHTYMELRIFDVHQVYHPHTFTPSYKSPHHTEYFSSLDIFDLIESFIPEINKHLLISFRPYISPHTEIHNINHLQFNDFECWGEYFSREYRKEANGYGHYY